MSDINITVNDEIVNIDVLDTPVLVNVVNSPGQQGPAGPGVPVGGTTGQVLKKLSGTNYDTYWAADAAGVSSVGLSMPSAFSVANSPITSSGTLAVTGSGSTTQYIDGTGGLQTFPLTLPVLQEVRNQTGATLDAGTVVYINGATGNKPTVTKAIATGDATSAQTLGMISAAIANNGVGYVVVIGTCGGLDTSAYTEGQQLYLSGTVAGGVTTTKPYAPIHLVYVGIVTRSHPNLGTIEVRVQNGIEVDEIHNVSAQTPSNNDGLFYNTSTSLWESKAITTALGYTPVPTTRNITINGVTYDLSADRTYTISTGISGSGASGQVTYWTGTSAVSGSNNLTFDGSRLTVLGSINVSSVDSGDASLISNRGFIVFRDTSNTTTNRFRGISSGFSFQDASYNTRAQISTSNGLSYLNAAGGNVSIGSGSDLGVRLGVVGDTLLRGSGATSATTALTVQNSSSTNLLRVANNGNVAIGDNTVISRTNLTIWKNITGDLTSFGVYNRAIIQTDVTTEANMFVSISETPATTYTLSSLKHYRAYGVIRGSGSIVTNQYGFIAESDLSTATNNYGFYGNIAFAVNRWNLYMNGTADNYLAGDLGIGTTSVTNWLNIGASTTSKAHINLASGVAPTSPANGDIWFDGTDIKMRIGGVTKTFTLV